MIAEKLVVGLGNPGYQYSETRHNVGFKVVERLAEVHHIVFNTILGIMVGQGTIKARRVTLAKPQLFMNNSGRSIAVLESVAANTSDIIVVHDDLDLEVGRVRIYRGGGDGGHRGVRSIIREQTGAEVIRIRVGVGRPTASRSSADYVLAKMTALEQEEFMPFIDNAALAAESVVVDGVIDAMNQFNRRGTPSSTTLS